MANMNAQGLLGRTPPKLPFWCFYIECALAVLGLGIFIAGCYASSIVGGGPGPFSLFVGLMLMIVIGSHLAIKQFAPQAYFRIAYVVSLPLLAIFSLSAWAWSASIAGVFLGESCYGSFGCVGYGGSLRNLGGALAACAALGAFAWVALIVFTVFYFLESLKDGGDDTTFVPPPAPAPDAEMGTVKPEDQSVPQPYGQPPYAQQQYVQQPYGQPQQGYTS